MIGHVFARRLYTTSLHYFCALRLFLHYGSAHHVSALRFCTATLHHVCFHLSGINEKDITSTWRVPEVTGRPAWVMSPPKMMAVPAGGRSTVCGGSHLLRSTLPSVPPLPMPPLPDCSVASSLGSR